MTCIIDGGDVADVIFLEFGTAFDSVNHRFLLDKLVAYEIGAWLIKWIEAFFWERRCHVSECVCICFQERSK